MEQGKSNYVLAFSIIIAALLITGAFIYSAGVKNTEQPQNEKKENISSSSDIENVLPISETDYPRGNPDAPVQIIEFSDLECPFCKSFHQTMKKAMDEYGKDGRIVWIYRHMPLESIHPKAKKSAEAAECAAELGGNNGYWDYIDGYFAVTPSNNLINLDELPKIAERVGLNRGQFEECLNSGRHIGLIEEHMKNAVDSGARGTPYSVIIGRDGKKYKISGAYPYEDFKDQYGIMQKGVKNLIEEALK